MIFEHFALNVEKPLETSNWYVTNCDMKVVKKFEEEPFTHFLADSTGRVVVEFYNNKNSKMLDFNSLNPLEFHFAFMVEDIGSVKKNFLEAGARVIEEMELDDGSVLIMLRDPYGIPLQLCQRKQKLMNF